MHGGRAILLLAATALCLPSCRTQRDGVLLITLDTVRADHVSSYGYAKQTTPYMDSLAREGTLFENAICTASTTPVSHASILTGLNPPRNGVRFIHGFVQHSLDAKVPTAAELYARTGYRSAAFISAFPLKSTRYGLNRGFEHYDESFLEGRPDPVGRRGFVITGESQRRAEETLRAFGDWIEREKPSNFFAWVHLFDAHDRKLVPPDEFRSSYLREHPDVELRDRRDYYDYEISYIDRQLELTIEPLRKTCSSLLILIVSDHGEGLGDHNYAAHGDRLYQEQIRVPLILWGHGVAAGRRIGHTVSTTDILPTLLTLSGIPSPDGLDGTDIMRIAKDRACYSETLNPMIKNGPPLFALTRGRTKVIHSPPPGATQCFDLDRDPRELTDLGPPTGPFAALLADLERITVMPSGSQEEMDQGTRENLKSLGYLD